MISLLHSRSSKSQPTSETVGDHITDKLISVAIKLKSAFTTTKTTSIKEAYDCVDILNDLNCINQAITGIELYGIWHPADQLDRKLRQKYPCINTMVAFAHSIADPDPRVKKNDSPYQAVLSSLEQDYFGILCDTAIKKQMVHSIEEFIKNVD